MRILTAAALAKGLLLGFVWLASPIAWANSLCVVPQGAEFAVAGPVSVSSVGNPDRNYPWAATTVDLPSTGYVEQEFWLCGNVATGAYTTRMIVRRPQRSAKFNGVVLAEWLNTTDGVDQDLLWLRSHDHIIRAGYAYVGISVQRDGLYATPNGLKNWSPIRYAELTFPQGALLTGTYIADPTSYLIYSQALKALKASGASNNVLGSLKPKWLIATGGSQSAGALTAYYDALGADSVADGYLPFNLGASMLSAYFSGQPIQANLAFPGISTVGKKPYFLVNSETEPAFIRQADSNQFRLWEVAGATHSDQDQFDSNQLVRLRDLDVDISDADSACAFSPRSRIHFKYVLNAAMDHLVAWIATSSSPRIAPRFQFGVTGNVLRDADGNVLGGIRLAGHAVPIALNTRENSGQGLCSLYGRHAPYAPEKLKALYPTRADYVQKTRMANFQNQMDGFVLPEDASSDKQAAQVANIPP